MNTGNEFEIHADNEQKHGGKGERGMAMVAVMLVLFVVMCVMLLGIGTTSGTSGVMSNTSSSLTETADRINNAQAFALADAGIEYTAQWLSNQTLAPANSTSFTSTSWNTSGSSVTIGSGQFAITIYPITTNSTGGQLVPSCFVVESVGTVGSATQIVRAVIEKTSFSHYQYYTNVDPSNGYWVCGMNSFDGPMHSNNANGVATNFLWYSAAGSAPAFLYAGYDAYTCCASTINWYENNLSTKAAPTTAANWQNIAVGGSSDVHTGYPSVALPTSNSLELSMALGTTAVPTNNGVIIPNSGGSTNQGIYIHGSPSQITLSLGTNSDDQVITVAQTATSGDALSSVITITPETNQTTLKVTDTPSKGSATVTTTTYSGTTNGVLYCDGNIGVNTSSTSSSATGGLYGTIADNYLGSSNQVLHYGSLVIGTPTTSTVNIDGNILYNTPRQTNASGQYVPENQDTGQFLTKAGRFGLVTGNAQVVDKNYAGTAITSEEVDGAVMTLASSGTNYTGTFDDTDSTTRAVGTFLEMGSYIAQSAGSFGEINNNGVMVDGLAETYRWDNRLSTDPPNGFPNTSNNYQVLSWQRVPATLQ